MSPLAVLGRGYSIAKNKDGMVIRKTGDAVSGTEFELVLSDGTVGAKFL